jgi:hypothetical protein
MPQWPLAQQSRSIDDLAMFNSIYGAALGYDYEFEGSGTSIPSGYSWFNQGTSTYREEGGVGVITLQNASGDNIRGITRSLSGFPSTWEAFGKFSFTARDANNAFAGFALRQSSDGKLVTWVGINGTGAESWKWNSPTGSNSAVVSQQGVYGLSRTGFYLRLKRNSATSFDYKVSADGRTWRTLATAQDFSAFMTADEIGFVAACSDNSSAEMACHWIRIR